MAEKVMKTTFGLIVLLFVSLCSDHDSHQYNVAPFERRLAPEKSHRYVSVFIISFTLPKVLIEFAFAIHLTVFNSSGQVSQTGN